MIDHHITLNERLLHLVADVLGSDFTFHVAEDGQTILAHKIILAAGSPVSAQDRL